MFYILFAYKMSIFLSFQYVKFLFLILHFFLQLYFSIEFHRTQCVSIFNNGFIKQ